MSSPARKNSQRHSVVDNPSIPTNVLNLSFAEDNTKTSIRTSVDQISSIVESQSQPQPTPRTPSPTPSKHPSCNHLPPSWTEIHDRFITYLATHAPLDESGRVQSQEERRERWSLGEMLEMLGERFPELRGDVKPHMIEKRLILLDLAGDNDYFKMPYGAYKHEEWGRDI